MTAAPDPSAPEPSPVHEPALRAVPEPALRAVPQLSGAQPSVARPLDAMPSVLAGLGVLARADWAGQPAVTLGQMLVELDRAESVLCAVRSQVLSAFTVQRGFEDDGQGSARAWLTWQSRITRPAANAAVTWARRLGEHPALAEALAGGRVSVSWARQLADWSDLLPASARGDADAILAAAAASGLDLAGLGELAEEIRRRPAACGGTGAAGGGGGGGGGGTAERTPDGARGRARRARRPTARRRPAESRARAGRRDPGARRAARARAARPTGPGDRRDPPRPHPRDARDAATRATAAPAGRTTAPAGRAAAGRRGGPPARTAAGHPTGATPAREAIEATWPKAIVQTCVTT